MLTSVSVVPPPGAFWSSLDIPVLAPDPSNGVFVEKVDGLEPVNAEVTTNGYNLEDGEFYVGSRVPKRNIVLHLIMERNSNYLSVAEVRRNLYGYFMPKMNVLLQLNFDDRDPVQIAGWVESFENDRWTNDPNVAVSIICPKPNFKAIDQQSVDGESVVGTDPWPYEALNDGDRMVGFELWITNDSAVDFDGDIKIQRLIEGSTPGEWFSTQEMYLDGVSLPSGLLRYVYVNTKQGEKVIQLKQGDDVISSLMGKMTDGSSWPVLWNAMNRFRVITTDTTGWAGEHLNFSLKYFYEYGGV